MGYFESYKNRLLANGANTADAFTNSTIALVNSAFKDSPSFANVNINGVNKESRLTHTKIANEMNLLLRPQNTTSIGDLVSFDGTNWLVFDNINNEVYPKATIRKCNESLKWTDALATVHEYYSIVEIGGTKFGITRSNEVDMQLLDGGMVAYVSYNAITQDIKITQRFILGSQVYEVEGIDDITRVHDGVGLIKFSLSVTTKKDGDNFASKIADNSHLTKSVDTGGGNNPW